VKRVDRVKRGDVIGHMGNSGNSTGPHLHLHIMNGPRILESDGVPYVFDNFTILREVADMNALDDDMAVKKPAVVKDSKFAGKHTHRLMREGQIVQFSE
jgi:murein DD-endopeptidase MepM/ murein hydrolase activator NlpD